MKSTSALFKSILFAATALCAGGASNAQLRDPLPHCSGRGAGNVYFATTAGNIYVLTPSAPGTPQATGIALPTGSTGGLAVSRNLNGGATSPTYYTTVVNGALDNVYYWDNVALAWQPTTGVVNTSHSSALGAGGGFLYGLDQASGYVFRYNGSTSAFVANVGATTINDITADCSGNFYVANFQTIGNTPNIRQYSSAGVLLNTYNVSNATVTPGVEGLGISGNTIYYDGNDGKLYSGVLSGTSVTFSAVGAATPFTTDTVADFGTCGVAGLGNSTGGRDTVLACGGANNLLLSATGPGPYGWTVLNGNATITGSGSTVQVSATTTSTITVKDADCSGINTLVDTIVVYVATATIDLSPYDRIIGGCQGFYTDTITAHVTNTSPGILYASNWTPLTYITGGQNDTTVFIQAIFPPVDTLTMCYHDSTSSGCGFSSCVKLHFVDSTPHPDFFSRPPNPSCAADTVQFINLTSNPSFVDSYLWEFGDTTTDNAISPLHIYHSQNIFSVTLVAQNGKCTDSVTRPVLIRHPLIARDSLSKDSICSGMSIAFKDKSNAIRAPSNTRLIFSRDFGDGSPLDTNANSTHTYRNAGTFYPVYTIRNGLGCVSVFRDTVRVDSLPFLTFMTPDTLLCEGQAMHIQVNYLTVGNTGTTLDFGDGTGVFQNTDHITYSYEHAGQYNFSFTATYRICPPGVYTNTIVVHPSPGVNLGPDTVLCPNAAPIVLADRINGGNPSAKYLWNTGETTPSIYARDNGTYWLRVNVAGCTGTDSVVVNKDCYIDIPNTFSPNGDGTNDYFMPRQLLSRSINAFHLSIFNRWGQMIFESRETNGRGWDGKFNGVDQPQGVYVYMIDVTFDNNVKEHYTGNVTLFR